MIASIDTIGDWISERCPQCGCQLLGSKRGDKWCSFVECSWNNWRVEGNKG